jgi:hypothetical protein
LNGSANGAQHDEYDRIEQMLSSNGIELPSEQKLL